MIDEGDSAQPLAGVIGNQRRERLARRRLSTVMCATRASPSSGAFSTTSVSRSTR
jgi:hypothetical protein